MKRLSGSVAKPYEKTNEEAMIKSFQDCLAEIRHRVVCGMFLFVFLCAGHNKSQ